MYKSIKDLLEKDHVNLKTFISSDLSEEMKNECDQKWTICNMVYIHLKKNGKLTDMGFMDMLLDPESVAIALKSKSGDVLVGALISAILKDQKDVPLGLLKGALKLINEHYNVHFEW